VSTLTERDVPVQSVRVRRRRYGKRICLILDNHYFDLDEVTDAIWTSCDGASSVAEIGERLHQGRGWALGPAVQATIATLAVLAREGLVTLVAGTAKTMEPLGSPTGVKS
jgi:hypothetical protein